LAHGRSHDQQDYGRAFAIGIVLNSVHVIVEAGIDLAIGSLRLVADAVRRFASKQRRDPVATSHFGVTIAL
jgi:Co/Zn/Cd efflux system component